MPKHRASVRRQTSSEWHPRYNAESSGGRRLIRLIIAERSVIADRGIEAGKQGMYIQVGIARVTNVLFLRVTINDFFLLVNY